MSEIRHKQALPAGFELKEYRVVAVLGVGGFGVTYLAEHKRLGHRVAIKEYLPNEFALREGAAVHPKSEADRESFEWGLERFLDEAKTLARFEHRNVVRVRDYFEANRTAYIVMDYEEGESLGRLLNLHGRLSEAQLRRILWPIVDGLRQVHAAGYLHRDIKPANVYVRRSDESPVLLDFGAAREALGRKSRSITSVASKGYSPPEQYETEGEQGPWTDIYALSGLCYRAITGQVPVEAPKRQGRLLRGQPDPLRKLSETVTAEYSPELLSAVDWGLNVIETRRPGSLDEWAEALEGVQAPADGPPVAPSPPVDVEQGSAVSAPRPSQKWFERKGAARVRAPLWGEAAAGVARMRAWVAATAKGGLRGPEWAAVGAATVALMALWAWWWNPEPTGNPRDAATAPQARAREDELSLAADEATGPVLLGGGDSIVVVTTEPPGVQVLIGGESAGETPLERSDVRAGSHDVELRHPAYHSLALANLLFVDGRVLRIERALVRGEGALTVITQPREAWVELDGVRLAERTPVTLEALPAGSLPLNLGAAEHRTQEVLAEVPKDRVGLLEWTLERIPYGSLTLEMEPPDATVTLPNFGPRYRPGVRLPEGAHRVVVSRQGYHSVERTVEVSGSTRERIALEPDPQPFTVQANPAQAQVELLEPAQAYAQEMRLEPGEYRVRVSATGYEPWEGAVRHGSEPTLHPVALTLDGTLEVGDFADDVSTVGAFPVNRTATGAIGSNGDTDWFRVELVADRTYLIDLEGSATNAGLLSDPYLRGLYDADGDFVRGTQNDDGGAGANSRVTFSARESGVYYVSAEGYAGGSEGTYTVSVTLLEGTLETRDIPDNDSTAGEIAVNGMAFGEIGSANDRDWFRVTLVADQIYRIDLEGSATGAGTLLNPYLRGLYHADGDRLTNTRDNNDGEGDNARLTFTVQESGIYYISAGGANRRDRGSYTLTVTSI